MSANLIPYVSLAMLALSAIAGVLYLVVLLATARDDSRPGTVNTKCFPIIGPKG